MSDVLAHPNAISSTTTEPTEARNLDLMQQSAADGTRAPWRPTGWSGLFRDGLRRAYVNLEGYFDDEGVEAKRMDELLERTASTVVDFAVSETKKRVGVVDWRYVFGEDCAARQTQTRREVDAAALVKWPQEVSAELAVAEEALNTFRAVAKDRTALATDEDRALLVEIYAKLQRRVDELTPRISDDDQLRGALRRYGSSIAMDWIAKLAFAVGGPDDAFGTTLSRSEASVANLSDAHRDEIFARHLADTKAAVREGREAFL